MGALHQGHLQLIQAAQSDYKKVVVSIFVNPTQFDRDEDFSKYPRTTDRDMELLQSINVDCLFLPTVDVIYPKGSDKDEPVSLGDTDKYFEGAMRPGHFDGVVQVVRRLLLAVKPHALFLGQKDAQQVAVLSHVGNDESWPEIITVPTVREDSGLAMSSRNTRLSEAGKEIAATIYKCLKLARNEWHDGLTVKEIEENATARLNRAGFETEYFSLIDADRFCPLKQGDTSTKTKAKVQIVTAAWLEGIRLIDNIML